ncbi:Envelope glycoprotein [Vulpes lagopus]
MNWAKGYSWGLRLYKERTDDGFTFKIKLNIESLDPVAVGPNTVLGDRRAPVKPTALAPAATNATPNNFTATPTPRPLPNTGQRLFNLITGAFLALNQTSPDITKSCWLCLVSAPPYYEGIATPRNYSRTTNVQKCMPDSHPQLTLTEVSGQGTCIGTSP